MANDIKSCGCLNEAKSLIYALVNQHSYATSANKRKVIKEDSKMKLVPLGDRVVLKKIIAEETTKQIGRAHV